MAGIWANSAKVWIPEVKQRDGERLEEPLKPWAICPFFWCGKFENVEAEETAQKLGQGVIIAYM